MRNVFLSRVRAAATAAALGLFVAACGGSSDEPVTPVPALSGGQPVTAPASPTAPPASSPTAPLEPTPGVSPAAESSPTSTPPSPPPPTPTSAAGQAPGATPTATPIAADLTIAVQPDCSFHPNPAAVQRDGVVRFANGADYLVEVAVFFADDAGFDGAEIEPGEVSPPIVAAHAGRAELTCEGPGLQFARGVLFVVSP